jgi:hypothetical protein
VPDAHQLVQLHDFEQAVVVGLQTSFNADLMFDRESKSTYK